MENATLHYILGSKGGCGKTFLSFLMAQKLSNPNCFDLDTESASFTSYESLKVQNLLKVYNQNHQDEKLDSDNIDQYKLQMMNFSNTYIFSDFLKPHEEWKTHCALVDTGGGTSNILLTDLLRDMHIVDPLFSGVKVYLNILLGGGEYLSHCLVTVKVLNRHLQNVLDYPDEEIRAKIKENLVINIWKNYYYGKSFVVVDSLTNERHDLTRALQTLLPLQDQFETHVFNLHQLKDNFYLTYLKQIIKDRLSFVSARDAVALMSEKIKIDRIKKFYFDQLNMFDEIGRYKPMFEENQNQLPVSDSENQLSLGESENKLPVEEHEN